MNSHTEVPITGTAGSFTVPGKIIERGGIHEGGAPGSPSLHVMSETGPAKTCFYEVIPLTTAATAPLVKNGARLRFIFEVNGPGGAPSLACIWEP